MKRNDTTFKEMVSRIESGELTRRQAADTYGIKYGTLCVWLGRSELAEKTRLKGKPLHGAALGWAKLDPDKAKRLDEAAHMAIHGELSVTQVSKLFPDIAAATLTKRVRKDREKIGLPVQRRNRRNHPLAPATPA